MNPSDEIKQRLDIVDVISESVSLQRAGRNFKAVCPFHVEKTPSFFVFPDRGTWHCFGACATGGDIFAFVMKKENLDFAGALRLLAERAGISLGRASPAAEETQRDRLRKANEAAALFFQHALGTQAGAGALDYMTMRGIDRETAQAFRLGYAPDSWDALREHLKGRGFSEAELLKAGLQVEGERGLYDRFRHRLVVPICDERGRTVGFGSRILPGEATSGAESDGPKYLNTPQTPIFDKGAVLYALDRALEHIRRADLAVIVEGYMDVIAAHQHGNTNVVASMGTALTERQLGLLRQLTENIVLAFDPDLAGQAASERGNQIARHLGAEIKVMRLPKGRDPDEIIRADPEEWRRLVTAAEPFDFFSAAMSENVPTEHGRRASSGRQAPAAQDESRVDIEKGEEMCLALLVRHPQLRPRGSALAEDLFVGALNRLLFQAWREAPPEADLRERLPEELRTHLEEILDRNMLPFDAPQAEEALTDCTARIEKRKLREEKSVSSQQIAEKEQRLGSARLIESALRQGEALPQDLPDDDTANATGLVRDMEMGLRLHDKASDRSQGNASNPENHDR